DPRMTKRSCPAAFKTMERRSFELNARFVWSGGGDFQPRKETRRKARTDGRARAAPPICAPIFAVTEEVVTTSAFHAVARRPRRRERFLLCDSSALATVIAVD